MDWSGALEVTWKICVVIWLFITDREIRSLKERLDELHVALGEGDCGEEEG